MAQLEFSQPALPPTALESQRERFKTYRDLICIMITDISIIICMDHLLVLNLLSEGYDNAHRDQWFPPGGDLTPRGHRQYLPTLFGCHSWRGGTVYTTGIFFFKRFYLLILEKGEESVGQKH